MTPGLRKFALTAHVTSSLGWFGAVAAFAALAIAGMISQDAQIVRAAYIATKLTTWFAVVPLAFISLLSGVVSSLGTNWGLFRYYWVLLKLFTTLLATIVLMIHIRPIELLAEAAAKTTVSGADLQSLQFHLVTASSAALIVLIALTVLSVYKPRGMTQYGLRKQHLDITRPHRAVSRYEWRKQDEPQVETGDDASVGPGRGSTQSTPSWLKTSGMIAVIVLVALFVIQHLPAFSDTVGRH
jgi:hypothetical protein